MADFFICHTKRSRRWECARFAQFQIIQPLQRLGYTTFFDVVDLEGDQIEACEEAAAGCGVLVAIMDDAFPTDWCIREMTAAMQRQVPIQTVLETAKFTWDDVGKDVWWHKQVEGRPIDRALIQYVFQSGTMHYNGHPTYLELAESKLLETLLGRLPDRPRRTPAEVTTPLCHVGCGRLAANANHEQPACCPTCPATGGLRHAPVCDASQRQNACTLATRQRLSSGQQNSVPVCLLQGCSGGSSSNVATCPACRSSCVEPSDGGPDASSARLLTCRNCSQQNAFIFACANAECQNPLLIHWEEYSDISAPLCMRYRCTKCTTRFVCFAHDTAIPMADGGLRAACELKAGDLVSTIEGNAEVLCVVRTAIAAGHRLMAALPGGLRVTPGHPIYHNGEWKRAGDVGIVARVPCSHVYNFALSEGHVITVHGVQCMTIGHEDGFVDSEFPMLRRAPGERGIDKLKAEPGWSLGLIEHTQACCQECSEISAVLRDPEVRHRGIEQQTALLNAMLMRGQEDISGDEQFLRRIHAATMSETAVDSNLRSGRIYILGAKHKPPSPMEASNLVWRHGMKTQSLLDAGVDKFAVAAYIMWWVVAVHPFNDGNGRLARGIAFAMIAKDMGLQLLGSWHTLFQGPRRSEYFAGLQHANECIGCCKCCDAGLKRNFNLDALSPLVELLKEAVAHP